MTNKALLAGFALLALTALPANAGTIALDDPLHIQCTGCIDNGTNTPLPSLGSSFGFSSSPPGATGVLFLEVLVPNNTNLGLFTIPSITGFASGTPNLFSATAWTAGTLNAYLGGSFSGGTPDVGIGAFLPSTQAVDPGATGFFTFLFSAGGATLGGPGAPLTDTFGLLGGSNLPVGSYITAMMLTTDGVINTANSGAGFITQQSINPVPIPAVGTGLPGILAGALFLFRWMRRRREGLHLPDVRSAAVAA